MLVVTMFATRELSKIQPVPVTNCIKMYGQNNNIVIIEYIPKKIGL